MNDLQMFVTATSSVLGHALTGEAAVALCVPTTAAGTGLPVGGPSLRKLDGTGLPTGRGRISVDAYAVVMGPDQVQFPVRIPAAAVTGIPPRRTPPRC